MELSDQFLELDEKLIRYWLKTPLTRQKRIEMELHLEKILEKRLEGCRRITTNA